MEAEESVVLTVVSGEPEADLLCGLLRSAGIECAYRDTEAIDSPLEDFTAAGRREILVRASDVEAARELLPDSAGWPCGSAERPVFGFQLGARRRGVTGLLCAPPRMPLRSTRCPRRG